MYKINDNKLLLAIYYFCTTLNLRHRYFVPWSNMQVIVFAFFAFS